ncbi:unnamed protein product [Peronospora destructor]|uniref:Tetratricopeptide repeat protein 1 n=1 Tax=Peronospora destructor TaxID=86335 RepID=A0AAV0VC05_9STRA|nr:unnamed protein product [Peronospora destructor]
MSESRFEVLEEETHYPATKQTSRHRSSSWSDSCSASRTTMTPNKRVSKSISSQRTRQQIFLSRQLPDAIECYTMALKLCPAEEEYAYSRAVYFSNRAACLLRLGRTEESVDECTQAVTLSPTYVKALLRRAEAFEKLDKLEEALADYDAVLKIDRTVRTAVQGRERLQNIVHERQEKMKAEMMDKLKGFGNTILGKFGLSTDNFQMVQDPTTGSYSINFQQNPGQSGQQKPSQQPHK